MSGGGVIRICAATQVAEYLRCSPSTVGRLLKKRDIPAFRLAQLPQLEGENKFFAGMGFGNT
jgi:hypothetical protein